MIHDTWADSATPVTLELYYDGAWQDVTAYVSDGGWTITRGRTAGSATAGPSTLTVTLDNADGRFSPRFPTSPLYGLVGRNTPVRATVTTNSVDYVRFVGEVAEWPVAWTAKGTATVTLTASGVTRRLGQGADALRSVYYRGVTSTTSPVESLLAYWPLEDGTSSSTLSSYGPYARDGYWVGSPQFASNNEFECSDSMVTLASGVGLTLPIAQHSGSTEYQAWFLFSFPDTITSTTRLFDVRTNGALSRLSVTVTTGGDLQVIGYDSTGAICYTGGVIAFGVAGQDLRVSLSWQTSGADTVYALSTLAEGAITGLSTGSATITGYVHGTPYGISIAPDLACDGIAVGHVTIQSTVTSTFALSDFLAAYANLWSSESAATRVQRLCTENNVASDIITTGGTTATSMGAQRPKTLLALLAECEASDHGILWDTRDALGISYRMRTSLYAQDPALDLTWQAGFVTMTPVDDDAMTRNKVTVTREGGASYTAELTTGPLGTASPSASPPGVGVYSDERTLSLLYDSSCKPHAEHLLTVGTVDAQRWPSITVDLAHPDLVADTATTADILNVDIGDRITVTGTPDFLPPEPVDALVVGTTEKATPSRHTITFVCVPYDPYRVHVVATDRVSSTGTTLAGPLPAGHVTFDGSQARTTSSAQQAGDLDVRVKVALTDWTPTGNQTIACKYAISGNQRSWNFHVAATTGYLRVGLSTNGSSVYFYTSTTGPGFTDGNTYWVRYVYEASSGDVTFYTSTHPGTWTQLGTTVSGSAIGGLYDAAAYLEIGALTESPTTGIVGDIYSIEILDGVDGDPLAPTDPTEWTDGYSGSGTGSTATTETSSAAEITTADVDGWTHADGDYTAVVGGETMTVTAVSGTAPSQTLTVTRSVNGVVKAHSAGDVIDLYRPAIVGFG